MRDSVEFPTPFLFLFGGGVMGLARRTVAVCLAVVSSSAVVFSDDSLPVETVQRLKDSTVYVKTKIGPVEMTGSGFVFQVPLSRAIFAIGCWTSICTIPTP